jgi:hypothetical protein
MVSHSDHEPAGAETQSSLDPLLKRLAAYFILEPLASALSLGLIVGGVGGNVASFAFGTAVGLVAASVLRQKYRDGKL